MPQASPWPDPGQPAQQLQELAVRNSFSTYLSEVQSTVSVVDKVPGRGGAASRGGLAAAAEAVYSARLFWRLFQERGSMGAAAAGLIHRDKQRDMPPPLSLGAHGQLTAAMTDDSICFQSARTLLDNPCWFPPARELSMTS